MGTEFIGHTEPGFLERPESRESTESRLDRALQMIEQQNRQIQQLTEMLRQQRQPVTPLRGAYAAVRSKSMIGNIYDDPNMRATTDGELWMRQVRDPMSDTWSTVEAKPLVQVSEIARNARYEKMRQQRALIRGRNDPLGERYRADKRETAMFAMGPEVYYNVGGARDRLLAPTVSGTDIAFLGSINRAGGADYISPTGNYAVLPMKAPAGRGVQAELTNHYANRMDGGALENAFEHLRGGDADRIFNALADRRSRWGNHPSWRYGDLAWARSQLEHIDKGRHQTLQFEKAKQSYLADAVIHTEAVPLSGDPFQQIMIKIPRELDPYGKEGHVLLQPNSVQQFWDSKSIAYANDAGIDYVVDKWPDGRARGIRILFTKPGVYNVAGKQVVVGPEGRAKQAAVQKERAEKKPRAERVLNFKEAPTKLIITPVGKASQTLDVSGLHPGEAMDANDGITVVRDSDGKFRIQHFEQGSYFLNVRWQGDHQRPFGRFEVR